MKTIIDIPDPLHKEIKYWNRWHPQNKIVMGWVCVVALEKAMQKKRGK